jgi:hypothetical protein
MRRKILFWETAGFFFIGLAGAALHFTFELTNFSSKIVAYFSAVNESTWEHFKLVLFPGLIFMIVEYPFVRKDVRNYLPAKTASLFVMPAVIALGWYAYTPFTGRNVFPLDLLIFYIAVALGQIVSYKILNSPPVAARFNSIAAVSFLILFLAFSIFTFFPPKIFLFEHFELQHTGKYGILDNYNGLRYFTKPK